MSKTEKKAKERKVLYDTASGSVRQVAAIDIGTSAIRLALAEIDADGQIRRLETLSQSVHIGRDTFSEQRISYETIEECVRILSSFKQVMQEYLVTQPDQVRAVATSAVREADNKDVFIDRIFMATGIAVEAIDEAETTRLTYLGVLPYLSTDPALAGANNLVVEVGGGSTEFLQMCDGNIAYSHVFPMGSLRSVESVARNENQTEATAAQQVSVLMDEVLEQLTQRKGLHLIYLGGEARFAARQIKPGWDANQPAKIAVSRFKALSDEVSRRTAEELVEDYHITYPEAETLAPALFAYSLLAEKLGVRQVLVSGITMRDGLLMEMVQRDAWSHEFNLQIIRSARELAEKYQANLPHAEEVASLAVQLFDELQEEHGLSVRQRLVLEVAALLHETGLFVSDRGYHKHSMYLVQHSEVFGLGHRNTALVAQVARYHQKAGPSLRHAGYLALAQEDRHAVSQLAAILRVADALGQSRRQRISSISCQRGDGQLTILVPGVEDLTLEQIALQEKGSLFQDVFGMEVMFRRKTVTTS